MWLKFLTFLTFNGELHSARHWITSGENVGMHQVPHQTETIIQYHKCVERIKIGVGQRREPWQPRQVGYLLEGLPSSAPASQQDPQSISSLNPPSPAFSSLTAHSSPVSFAGSLSSTHALNGEPPQGPCPLSLQFVIQRLYSFLQG